MSHNEHQERQSSPPYCKGNCGKFFGDPMNGGFCSKCVKTAGGFAKPEEEAVRAPVGLRGQQAPSPKAPALPEESGQGQALERAVEPAPQVPTVIESPAASSAVDQKDPTRCWTCNKKIGITAFMCRCQRRFCNQHRMPEAHKCGVDYKLLGREQLAKNNPLIQAAKMDRL